MSRPTVQMRSLREQDVDALFDMYRDIAENGGALPLGGVPTREVFIEGWVRNREVFVAWKEAEIVGSYFLRSNFPAFAGHIAQSGYTVAAVARRQGIGRFMVGDSLVTARRLGFTAMMFNLVFEKNPSRSLYESLGFTEIGRIPEARPGEAGIIYWRSL